MYEIEKIKNTLIYGDNNVELRKIPDNSIDLIYLDPPFFSGRNYEVIWGDKEEVRSFEDRFEGNIENYIAWMKERIIEMHRILKPTGSIYLHCDWHASHYLKIVMDVIFGYNNFRNEIIWEYQPGSAGKKDFGKKHDTILRYSKTDKYKFYPNDIREPYSEKTIERLKHSGAREKNIDKVLERGGRIPIDVWYYPTLQGNSKESLGYPTQKPEALLERIIKASSNPGDWILDPFCGCGTSIAVAKKLNRNFIGIDVSLIGCKVAAKRIEYPESKILNLPITQENLDKMKPEEFQQWACDKMSARNTNPHGEKSPSGVDGGKDGIIKLDVIKYQSLFTKNDISSKKLRMKMEGCPIEVKHHENNVGVDVVKKLYATMMEMEKDMGFIIAHSFGSGAKEQVAIYSNKNMAKIYLVTSKELMELKDGETYIDKILN